MTYDYDIIVIGAGHAGSEASAAAANLGCKTLLITIDLTKIAAMSCNPAIGGIAKGQIVREIDALGGLTGIVTDESSIQFRMLNRSKGPAMWSPRAQCDKTKFSLNWRKHLESISNLSMWQDIVVELLIEEGRVFGVKTKMGLTFKSKAVVLTAGTFLEGLIHVGMTHFSGGRMADPESPDFLLNSGITIGRMKTGTPVRIDGRTIDFSQMTRQDPENTFYHFSYFNKVQRNLPQLPCYITYTNPEVHNILRNSLDQSPLFNGTIKSIGPRYCPSIETKIVNFDTKDRHQLFLEPEGTDTNEYYLNGFSSSLPWQVQFEAIKQIPGLQDCHVLRPGYAIEYDYFDPTELNPSLESKIIQGLFLAGQVNGTTGYEEAAGQGLIAGINAARKVHNQDPVILRRDQAYIGVLIDDLINKGVDEPYRMFTSRAEYRILLRQDNADERLSPIGKEIGLLTGSRLSSFVEKSNAKQKIFDIINNIKVTTEQQAKLISQDISQNISKESHSLHDLLKRPDFIFLNIFSEFNRITKITSQLNDVNIEELIESIDTEIKYSGYIEKEQQQVDRQIRLENYSLKDKFDYMSISALSYESREKLNKIKPETIAQARRIPGVSPSDISVLLTLLGR